MVAWVEVKRVTASLWSLCVRAEGLAGFFFVCREEAHGGCGKINLRHKMKREDGANQGKRRRMARALSRCETKPGKGLGMVWSRCRCGG